MLNKNKFYLTTAIAYVNAPPHLGHAMEFVETDTIARYKRLMGFDTFFLTGTDEHGVKIYNTAKKENIGTQELVDKYSQNFKELKSILNLSNDDFIQTSDKERHWPACQKLWRKLAENGDIFKKEYEGKYCEGCEMFMKESELLDGKCPTHKTEPVLLKEENYFFRLSKYSEQIVELIESKKLRILPEFREAEFLNLAKEGLTDISFSRPRNILPWGVDVPDDPSQVMYVWCDALTNYISGIGYATDSDTFNKYWPADMHVIGKDIVRFHAGYWIGMLLSAGIELPKSILIHGFITHNGEKMSKTLGNVVNPVEVANKYGTDALRYYLLREIPVGRDGDFNDKLFKERYNSDLANNLGNLLNRVYTLISKNNISDFKFNLYSDIYKEKTDETWKKYIDDMEGYNLHEAIFHVFRLVDFANKMIEDEKPWALIKENSEKGRAILCNLLEVLRHISIMLYPFIPESAVKIRRQIGLSEDIDAKNENGWGVKTGWLKLGEQEILFPRIDVE
ncbi:methionine--tRNA ligase [Candidatus Peregrinibacteria bacterium]|nr:methionine--tRNA ligase [Candidatus Peregrinibacteria bacterium]